MRLVISASLWQLCITLCNAAIVLWMPCVQLHCMRYHCYMIRGGVPLSVP